MKLYRKLIIIYLAIGTIAVHAFANDLTDTDHRAIAGRTNNHNELLVLDEGSSLSDYLAYAALNNPDLEAAFYRWRASLEEVNQARSFPDPQFTYSYFIKEIETRVGPQRQKFGISQTLPWFGKLAARGEIALQTANIAEEKYEATKLRLFYEVKKGYYEYYYLSRAIDITEEHVQLLTDIEKIVMTKYKVGAASYADIMRAQIELDKTEDRLQSLHELCAPVASRLNAALNRSPDASLPFPRSISIEKPQYTVEQLYEWLKENNPDLKALDYTMAKDKSAVELAEKRYFPDITLGAEYIDTDNASMPGTIDSGKDPIMLKLSINLPFWIGTYRAEERQARSQLHATQQERQNKEKSLVADLKMAVYYLEDTERKVTLYGENLIPKAEQSLSVTRQAYTANRADFLDLIDTQRTLLEFQLLYERDLASYCQNLAKLEMLVGVELTHSGESQFEEMEKKEVETYEIIKK